MLPGKGLCPSVRYRKVFIFAFFCWASLVCTTNALAEIYRWTDAKGKVHFSDKPSAKHKSKSVELRINTYESVSYETSSLDTGKKVIMYSATWCGVCQKAKRYFQANRIPFKEYDIDKSSSAKRAFRKLGGKGVPVILVGKQRMNGFSQAGFERLYHGG
jgi:glutaredoxin